ncbi:MAG: MetQ/NlpA family ABC transporter substrate-binding protein [Deferribacteraceae bacterium]|jgi:D-methionine transport system substrate-binding protein|nr:MetQ/NlpA family ABC transporter substrate-binding protein [Deferribacteraceae bacterium]
MKKILITLLVAIAALTACKKAEQPAATEAATPEATLQVLKVGATPVPHAAILELIKDDLKAAGVELEIIEFTDYVTPNIALNDGQIDANFFQHQPYLDSFIAEHSMDLVSLGGIHVEPLGLYSQKMTEIGELADGATIAIANDPTNEGRALLLLQANGLLTVNPEAGLEATPIDIVENPKNLKFSELDAAQLPRVLEDVDAAIINGNYAMEAKFNPEKDALILEGAESPYVNIITIKKGMENDPRLQALMTALKSDKVKTFISENYAGGVVAVF